MKVSSSTQRSRVVLKWLLWPAGIGVVLLLVPLIVFAANTPQWWADRGVVNPNAQPNDYAAVNQGQVKNIAVAAISELNAFLPGGAGDELNQLAISLSGTSANANDYAAVNLGQLKNLAKPFYDRLIAVGYTDKYPWANSPHAPNDYAMANVGQVKNLFSFDVTSDKDHNGTPDWMEKDSDGDGLSNGDELRLGTDPRNPDSEGDGIPDGWEVAHGLNPRVKDSDTHLNGHTLTALQEYLESDVDSDGDLLPDKWERAHGMNPFCADEDGNGVIDGNDDWDGDGQLNVWEYRNGTDPFVPDGPAPGRVINLVSTPTEDGGFDLTWDISVESSQPFQFQRRRQDGSWRPLITAPSDARSIHVGPELLEPTDE